jgi:hypothetical protein
VDLFVAREEVHIDDEELVPVGSGGGRGEDGRKELRMVRDENIEPKERQPEAFFQMESDVLESLWGRESISQSTGGRRRGGGEQTVVTRDLLRDVSSSGSGNRRRLCGDILRFQVMRSVEFMARGSSWLEATVWGVMDIATSGEHEWINSWVIEGAVEIDDVKTGGGDGGVWRQREAIGKTRLMWSSEEAEVERDRGDVIGIHRSVQREVTALWEHGVIRNNEIIQRGVGIATVEDQTPQSMSLWELLDIWEGGTAIDHDVIVDHINFIKGSGVVPVFLNDTGTLHKSKAI